LSCALYSTTVATMPTSAAIASHQMCQTSAKPSSRLKMPTKKPALVFDGM
jgi:hypothetical protein